MADIAAAIQYVLSEEDATLSGVITSRKDNNGHVWLTRYGIDQQYYPELTNCLFYSSMGSIAARAIAERLYRAGYAEPMCIAEIPDQKLANKLLSLGINCGAATASKMLQDVLGVEGDGRIGPITLDKLDRADPNRTLDALKERAVSYYERLVDQQPQLKGYLKGWLHRAES